MDRGAAISAADARQLWATLLREAHAAGLPGDEARGDLRIALEHLAQPRETAERHARLLVADLIEASADLLAGLDSLSGVRLTGGPRTIDAMIDGYFADVTVEITPATRKAYLTQSKRIRASFGARRVDEVTRGELRGWYLSLKADVSVPTANLAMGAFGAFYKWAGWQDWLTESPVSKLGLERAHGRRVYWTLDEERAFVSWCDANGFADIADGVTACLWTGARIIDVCRATLRDLSGDTWRFVPQKTCRRGLEALPALLPVVKARVERRRAAAIRSIEDAFLVAPTGRIHDTASFGQRFRTARGLAVAASVLEPSFCAKTVQDTRDTCVTRLAAADVPFMKIWPWTGHSPSDAEDILRDHYIVLREEGALQTAGQLAAWAEANRLTLNA